MAELHKRAATATQRRAAGAGVVVVRRSRVCDDLVARTHTIQLDMRLD